MTDMEGMEVTLGVRMLMCIVLCVIILFEILATPISEQEAGGIVTDMEGMEVPLGGGDVVASLGGEALHTRVLGLIQEAIAS